MPPATDSDNDSDEVFPLIDTALNSPASVRRTYKSAATTVPPPRPKPVLAQAQRLARVSPQPERIVTVLASPVPLIEAARPLLGALVRMTQEPDYPMPDNFRSVQAHEVTAFQSVCQEARIRYEEIVAASYMLCTALDDVLNNSAWGKKSESTARAWAGGLATKFHGDNKGGLGVFRIIGYLLNEPEKHLDLLELVLLVMAMGFKGIYRTAPNGQRGLGRIRERVYALVYAGRGGNPSPRWAAIERLLRNDVAANEFSESTMALLTDVASMNA
jgi:type VI secretion system protein ImpK